MKKQIVNIKSEYHKITWPNRKMLRKKVSEMLGVAVAFGIMISVTDQMCQYLVNGLLNIF